MFRSQTDEQLAARWDVNPYLSTDGTRSAFLPNGTAHRYRFDPRVEYIPSRYVYPDGCTEPFPVHEGDSPEHASATLISRPPVNPILVALRMRAPTSDRFEMLHLLDSRWVQQFTYAERAFAYEVIERLAALA